MYLEFNSLSKIFQIALKNKQTYRAVLGTDKVGVITRINNALESMDKQLESTTQKLQNLELQCKNAKENLSCTICTRTRMQEKFGKIKEVNKLLKIGDTKEREVIDIDDEQRRT